MPPTQEEIKAALAEISRNGDSYKYLLDLIATKERDPVKLISASSQAVQEAQKDISAILPVVMSTASSIKEGVETSEFKMASVFGKVLMLIMILAPVIDGFAAYMEAGHFGTGMIVSGVAAVLKALVTVSYINSRKDIKIASASSPTQTTNNSIIT